MRGDFMEPVNILTAIKRLEPGRLLDIGARDCKLSRAFAELGYRVDALDPQSLSGGGPGRGVTFHQTRFEDFDTNEPYDLILASLVSHHIDYTIPEFLLRLKAILGEGGLIYITLLGSDDGWAASPRAKAMDFEQALHVLKSVGLRPVYRSSEWLEGYVYSGEAKYWNLYRFVLERETCS
ncbi:bifunctional 2-polyprenyl-6-hydroxyphenol methylase/3-demethylubiquinol 3-O-methyltransferase UbiG [Roseibium sp. RKSG952]|uniref:class I SAM-dependent methyltransferase n=1 Tax=Roseibium sp. RKSG952 TaxID=2529384 RepID=UPI0012BD40A3|nr:methyltransferase domain-containing protein [Roseibium sp. RKSG952]MTH95442.1 methyltransferase domain-containing protein [Roseibium sp. RKSG952]